MSKSNEENGNSQPSRPVERPLPFLPKELWQKVCSHASPRALVLMRFVCWGMRELLDEDCMEELWCRAYNSEWRAPLKFKMDLSWRSSFLRRFAGPYSSWGVKMPTVCTMMGSRGHRGTVTCVSLGSLKNSTVLGVSGSDDGAVFGWKINPRISDNEHEKIKQHHRQQTPWVTKIQNFYGHSGPVWALRFDIDRSFLASGGYDSTVKVWSLDTGRCLQTFRGNAGDDGDCGWVTALELLRMGTMVVSGQSDGKIRVWDLSSGSLLGHAGPPRGDRRHFCTGLVWAFDHLLSSHHSLDSLIMWDLETTAAIDSTFKGHESDIYCLHTDGLSHQFVSGSKDHTVRLWDSRGLHKSHVLRGHTGAVLDVKLHGNRIVSCSMDKTVKVWDSRRAEEPITSLVGHGAAVHCVDFVDALIVSGSVDTSLRLWTVV